MTINRNRKANSSQSIDFFKNNTVHNMQTLRTRYPGFEINKLTPFYCDLKHVYRRISVRSIDFSQFFFEFLTALNAL